MSAGARRTQIDDLMEQATQALADTRYFEAERLAVRALDQARQAKDFARMARITLPLQEARRLRYQLALDVGTITILDEPLPEDFTPEPGCYLGQPPQVGADARRLRLRGLETETPIAVLCREPQTMLRLCPIVAIGPGVTVRVKVDPPDDPRQPDLAWFVDTMEALGDAAIDELDAALTPLKRVDALLGRLEAIPEHENLHQALADACRTAELEAAEQAEAQKNKPRKNKAGSTTP